jgi:hypothetical protein
LNQANSFTSTGEHLFNGLIRVARIEPRLSTGGEVYSECQWRFNNDNVFYKDGSNGYKNLRDEINSVITTNNTQNTRLNSIESLNTTQNTRLDNIESLNTTQNTRLDNIESLNTTQNTRLTNIESLNTTQNTRLDNIESLNTSQTTSINTLTSALNNTAKINQANDFGSFTNTFDTIYVEKIRNNYEYWSGAIGSITLNSSRSMFQVVNSSYNGDFEFYCNALSSNEDGMIWNIRMFNGINFRLIAGSNVDILNLDNSTTANKLYQSKRSIQIIYLHNYGNTTNKRYVILSEN